jgi:hypothetical protein
MHLGGVAGQVSAHSYTKRRLKRGELFFKIEQLFHFNLKGIGNLLAAFDGWGVDTTFDQADKLDGIVSFLREGFLGVALLFSESCNSSS